MNGYAEPPTHRAPQRALYGLDGYDSDGDESPRVSKQPHRDHDDSSASGGQSSSSDFRPEASDEAKSEARRTQQRVQKADKKSKASSESSEGKTSKRQERIQKNASEHGSNNIGSDGELRGRTRINANGLLEWCEFDVDVDDDENWILAGYHNDHRQALIQIDSTNPSYTVAPPSGNRPLDITSNCGYLNQNTWSFETKEDLSRIRDADGNQVFVLTKPPRSPEKPQLDYMYHHRLLMLDKDDHPVVAWPGLPLCFSTVLEGARMEAIRRTMPWVRMCDMVARMPSKMVKGVQETKLIGLSAFGQRMSRFRTKMYLSAFTERKGTAERNQRLVGGATSSNSGFNSNDDTQTPPGPKPTTKQQTTGTTQTTKRQRQDASTEDSDSEDEQSIRSSKRPRSASAAPITPAPGRAQTERLQGSNYHQTQTGSTSTLPNVSTPASASQRTGGSTPALESSPPQGSSSRDHSDSNGSTGSTSSPHYGHNPESTIEDGRTVNIDPRTQQPIDYRAVRPRTPREQLLIQTALYYTFRDYETRYNATPPQTNHNDSCSSQETDIQMAHRLQWQGEGEVPPLISIGRWIGTFEDIPGPEHMNLETAERMLGLRNNAEATAQAPTGEDAMDVSADNGTAVHPNSTNETPVLRPIFYNTPNVLDAQAPVQNPAEQPRLPSHVPGDFFQTMEDQVNQNETPLAGAPLSPIEHFDDFDQFLDENPLFSVRW